jgi:hypothetical protein
MADTKVKDETVIAAIDGNERFYIVDDPTGTPLDRYATPALLLAYNKTAMPAALILNVDGGGSAIATGIAKGVARIPFACSFTQVEAYADQTGSCTVDIIRETYSNYPPDATDKMSASAPVTLSSAVKSTDSTLTGWTKTFAAGDIVKVNVLTASTITFLTIVIPLVRS